MKTLRLILVEDTYGVGFHREIIRKLYEKKILSGPTPKIGRLPAKKCNPAIIRKTLAKTIDHDKAKIIIVIDTERRNPQTAIKQDVIQHLENHFKNKRKPENITINTTTVDPNHEAWLCIGLGGTPEKCRQNPQQTIETIINRKYSKDMLEQKAKQVNIENLLKAKDFKKYTELLKQIKDP